MKSNVLKVVAFGTLIRLLIAAISIGTNDAATWRTIAEHTRDLGLIQAYTSYAFINHPLPPIYWAQIAPKLGMGREWPFAVIFKLPFIAADAGSC